MQRGVLFRGLRFVAVIVVSLAVAGLLMVLRPRAERQAPPVRPPLVTVQPVRAAPATLTVEAFGTVVPRDPLTLVGGTAVLLVVATAATLLPARNATRIPPTEAMRVD